MPCTRHELEKRERAFLAPSAQFSAETRGRIHAETSPKWRTHFQRDRDRVIHSKAFRRLEYKTQVFLNGTGDHLRTRLTHTIEVAGIARNLARALRLNEDLAETIALAHDLGHAPFGHTGEGVLNQLMRKHGGFEHNRQSLRVVEELEQKYPGFPGLNLTWEVREGLMKHFTSDDSPSRRAGFPAKSSSLEAQTANLADEIAYYSHDLDDGLEAGLLSESELRRHTAIWNQVARRVRRRYGELPEECRRSYIIRSIIDDQVTDVVSTSESRLRDAGVKSADDVRLHPQSLVQYSAPRARQNLELRQYLYENLYYNPAVHEPNLRASRMLEELFKHCLEHHEQIGEQSRQRARRIGWPRAVCDYISGMTDRYLLGEYERWLGGAPSRPAPAIVARARGR